MSFGVSHLYYINNDALNFCTSLSTCSHIIRSDPFLTHQIWILNSPAEKKKLYHIENKNIFFQQNWSIKSIRSEKSINFFKLTGVQIIKRWIINDVIFINSGFIFGRKRLLKNFLIKKNSHTNFQVFWSRKKKNTLKFFLAK